MDEGKINERLKMQLAIILLQIFKGRFFKNAVMTYPEREALITK
jgi:hypothetical protein